MNATSEPLREPSKPPKTYRKELLIRFGDCDPAGIVFYPRYLEMFNELVEDWCRDELSFSFPDVITRRGWGLPTVRLEVDFLAPSSFGEVLKSTLVLRNVGRTSITIEIVFMVPDGPVRVRGKVVLVLIDRTTRRPIALPSELRLRLASFGIAG
jgi:4-hydroxybenzoyl-CoA thioesterase